MTVTDDLLMGAIRERYGVVEAGRLALAAGADLLLYSSYRIEGSEICLRCRFEVTVARAAKKRLARTIEASSANRRRGARPNNNETRALMASRISPALARAEPGQRPGQGRAGPAQLAREQGLVV